MESLNFFIKLIFFSRKLCNEKSKIILNREKVSKSSELIKSETQWKFWTPPQSPTSTFDVNIFIIEIIIKFLIFQNEEVNQCLKDSFERTIKWKFEDLQMVLGSNLPIFGRGEYPAVTLRLR